MNQVFYMLEGAAYLGGAIVAGFITIKTVAFGRLLIASLAGIPKLVESNQRVSDEIAELVRLLQAPLTPNFGVDPNSDVPAQPRTALPPRPTQPWDTFTPVTYEAGEDETDVIDTSEADLAAYEQLDELKARGIEVEDDLDKNPPGVEAHV